MKKKIYTRKKCIDFVLKAKNRKKGRSIKSIFFLLKQLMLFGFLFLFFFARIKVNELELSF